MSQSKEPLEKTKEELAEIVERLRSADSPVGIDAVFTHAVIIDYLKRMAERLDQIEQRLGVLERSARCGTSEE